MIDRACISINSICNLNCKYCYFYERDVINTKSTSDFTKEEIIEIFENILEYSMRNNIKFKVGIVGSGEPLLNIKQIIYILKWLEEKQERLDYIQLYTISNGYNIPINTLDILFKYKHIISTSFSLDGYRELHNYARVKRYESKYIGTFDSVWKTITNYEYLFKCKPSINITVHKQTIYNKHKLIKFLDENKFTNITFSRLVDCEDENLSITDEEFNNFIWWLESNDITKRMNIRNIMVKNKKIDCSMYGAKCGVGKTNIFFANKKIYPCGRFISNEYYELGRYNDKLNNIEETFSKLKTLSEDEKCYYDSIIKDKRGGICV